MAVMATRGQHSLFCSVRPPRPEGGGARKGGRCFPPAALLSKELSKRPVLSLSSPPSRTVLAGLAKAHAHTPPPLALSWASEDDQAQ